MRYFHITPQTTLEELKAQHRALCLHMHPDRGGNSEQFARMEQEYLAAKALVLSPGATPPKDGLPKILQSVVGEVIERVGKDPQSVIRFATRLAHDRQGVETEVTQLAKAFAADLFTTLTKQKGQS